MRRYFAEFNRARGDSIRRTVKSLRRRGIFALILPHRTALEIIRPVGMSWADFIAAIRAQLQPRRGSVMISSEATGNSFICSNAGNQPGRLRRL